MRGIEARRDGEVWAGLRGGRVEPIDLWIRAGDVQVVDEKALVAGDAEAADDLEAGVDQYPAVNGIPVRLGRREREIWRAEEEPVSSCSNSNRR